MGWAVATPAGSDAIAGAAGRSLGGDGLGGGDPGAATASSTLVRPCLNSPSLVATAKVPPVVSARQLRGLRSSTLSAKPTTWMRSAGDFSFNAAAVAQISASQLSPPSAIRTMSNPPCGGADLAASLIAAATGDWPFGLIGSSSLLCVAKVSSPGLAKTSLSAQFEALRWPKATSPKDSRSP